MKLCKRNITPHIRKREYDSDATPPSLEAENIPLDVGSWNERSPGKTIFVSYVFAGLRSPTTGLLLTYLACTSILWNMCSHESFTDSLSARLYPNETRETV